MRTFFILLLFLLGACSSEAYKPDFYYKAEFDIELVDQVDKYFKELAIEEKFEVFEKKREEMRALTQGKDAFYISYYVGDQKLPVLWVTNVGTGVFLDLGLLSNEQYDLTRTRNLALRVVSELKSRFGIQMVKVGVEKNNWGQSLRDPHKTDSK